jgi:type IV secretion system protein VirB6
VTASCPADNLDSIAALLAGIDCRIAGYVEAAYRGLYGPVGWLGPVLTGALTIYVAFYAYRLITGHGRLSVSGLTRRFLAVGVVVALSSNWAAYQTAVAGALSGGGEEIASALLRATGAGSKDDVGARLDAAVDALSDLASNWGKRAPLISEPGAAPSVPVTAPPLGPGGSATVNMLWFSALALALGSAGVIVIAKVMLGFLLALGPIFILLALFASTRGFFEGWLRTAAANALIPLFAMAAAAAMLPVVEPMIATIADNEARGVTDAKPVFILSIAALVFAVLMAQIVAMTTRLAGAFRMPQSSSHDEPHSAAPVAATAAHGPSADPRIVAMIAAVSRDSEGREFAARPRAETVLLAPPTGPAQGGELRRVAGAYRGFGAAARRGESAA